MDKLRAMRVFRRIAELGSFAAAAKDVGISPAFATKNLSALEADLGVQLIRRTTRRQSLTEAGQAYLERVIRILDDLDEAELAIGSLQAVPRGRVRLAAPMSYGLTLVAPAIPALLARHPELEIDLVLNDRRVDLVDEGFDLALRVATSLADSSLVARRVGRVERVLCAAPSYVDRRGAPHRPEEVIRHEALVFAAGAQPSWPFVDPADGRTIEIRPSGRFACNNSLALKDALLAGLGLTLTPETYVAEDLAEGRLVRLLDAFRPVGHDVFAVYPPSRHAAPKVRAVIDHFAESWGRSAGC